MKNASSVVDERDKANRKRNERVRESRRVVATGVVVLSSLLFGNVSLCWSASPKGNAQTTLAIWSTETTRIPQPVQTKEAAPSPQTAPNSQTKRLAGPKRFYDLSETPSSVPTPTSRPVQPGETATSLDASQPISAVRPAAPSVASQPVRAIATSAPFTGAGSAVEFRSKSERNDSGSPIVPVSVVAPRSETRLARPASTTVEGENESGTNPPVSSGFVAPAAIVVASRQDDEANAPVPFPTTEAAADEAAETTALTTAPSPNPPAEPVREAVSASAPKSAPSPIPNAAPVAPAAPVPNVRFETLNEAIEIALAASRSQQALALKKNASRSVAQAARSLRNPKLTNTTAYVGTLNQPKAITEIDSSAISHIIPIFPSTLQTETPLLDKNFAATATAVTVPIYLGGRVQALTESAEATTRAIEAGEEVGEQNLKFEVSEAYFLVLRTRELNRVATEATTATAAHLTDAERLFKVGIATKNVVLAAQVAVAEARQTELRVETARHMAEAAYNRLLWRPLESPVNIADVDLGRPVGDLESLTAQATRNRSELRALTEESRALQAQIKVARADVLPQVAAVGAYTYLQNSNITENSNATGAVGVTWTPFDGGTSRARQDAARQEATSVARARDEAEEAIRLQVYAAWVAEKEARQRVETARVAVEQAEENLRVVTRGFQEGLVNHTETLDATTLRTAAKSNLANAKYDAISAGQRLRRAVGDL